jgi:L-fuconate dehydratase
VGEESWRLLLDLSAEQIVSTLDLSYLEEALTQEDALGLLNSHQNSRSVREGVLGKGYPGYDTSIGWFNYSDEQVRENVKKAVAAGFTAMKLKVGSPETACDIRRAYLVREGAGDDARVMLDVNQSWTLPKAISTSKALSDMSPYWIEEPTQPDDVFAHQTLAREIAPIDISSNTFPISENTFCIQQSQVVESMKFPKNLATGRTSYNSYS